MPSLRRCHDLRRDRCRTLPLCALLLAALAACAPASTFHTHTATGQPAATAAPRSLAHDGGIRLVLRASCPQDAPACDSAADLPRTLAILRQRAVYGLGILDAVVRQQSASDLVVELPADRDLPAAVAALTTPGHVAFVDTAATALPIGQDVAARTCAISCAPGQFPVIFTGEQVDPASVSAHADTVTLQGYVVLAFAGDHQARFAEYTHTHLGQHLTVTRDGIVVESAVIADIVPGATEITGLPTLQDARVLAAYLKDGPLPLSLRPIDSSLLSPTR